MAGTNKVIYGNQTIMDISDSTTEASNLLQGEVGYSGNGDRVVGTYIDNNNRRSFYGTCTDSASTVAKKVTLSNTSGWELVPGTTVSVKFSNTNTATGVTLNVNGTGAKKIWYSSSCYTDGTGTSTTVYGTANRIITYVYDGTYWVWLSQGADANTTYSTMAANEVYTGTETTAKLARADRLKTDINKLIDDKVNALDVTVSGASASKTLSALSETNGKISATFQDIQIAESQVTNLATDLVNKVDKVSGKGLSTNDYTDAEKTKVSNALPKIQNANATDSIAICSGGGTYSYFKIATLVISGTNQNKGSVVFEISQRRYPLSRLQIGVTGPSTAYTIQYFTTDYDNHYWLKIVNNTTWELYGAYNEKWGSAYLHRITGAQVNRDIAITVVMQSVEDIDTSTMTQVEYGGNAGYATSAGSATSAGDSSTVGGKVITDTYSGTSTNGMSGKAVKAAIDAIQITESQVTNLTTDLGNKVDKVSGKGLSTNDYTTTEKNKLAGIASGAEVNVQSDWNVSDSSSDAFIKNKPTIPPAYSLPAASSTTRGGIKIGYSETGQNYALKLSSEKGYVTVPWTDTDKRKAFFGTTTTAAATATKVVTLNNTDGWELKDGVVVGVYFNTDANNTATSVKLNVNGSGAKSVSQTGNSAYTSTNANITGRKGYTTYYMYNGTYWCFLNASYNVNTDTDTKVTQTRTPIDESVSNGFYPVLFSNSASTATATETARKTDNVGVRLAYDQYGFQQAFLDSDYISADHVYAHLGTSNAWEAINMASQSMIIASSPENDYRLFFGVWGAGGSNPMWALCPDTDQNLNLGTVGKRWKQVYAASSTISTSDRNEKKDISPLDESAKDLIMALNPVSYKFINGDTGRTHYGMISQDIEETLSELGMTAMDFAGFCKDEKEDKSGYIYGLRYEEFIAPLIKTVQMQQQEIEELKRRIDILEGGQNS